MSVWMLCVCVFMRFMSTNKVISNRTKLPFLKYFSIILSTFPTYTSAISSSSSPLFFLFHSFDTITMHMNPYSLLEMKLYNAPNYRKKTTSKQATVWSGLQIAALFSSITCVFWCGLARNNTNKDGYFMRSYIYTYECMNTCMGRVVFLLLN